MNALARRTEKQPAPRAPAIPTPSPWLAEAMNALANPHPDTGPDLALMRPGVREEAQSILSAAEARLSPAAMEGWRAFLRPLETLPNGPKDQSSAEAAMQVIAFALADVPAVLLTPNRQREALRTFRFWPSPHDLEQIFRPTINEMRREITRLRAVAKAPDPAEANRASEAERARIAAGFQALRDDLQRRTGEVRRDAPRPSYLVGPALEAARAKLRQQA